jgi:hypothetical protein
MDKSANVLAKLAKQSFAQPAPTAAWAWGAQHVIGPHAEQPC